MAIPLLRDAPAARRWHSAPSARAWLHFRRHRFAEPLLNACMRQVLVRLLLLSLPVVLLPAAAQPHADGAPATAATPAQVRLPSLDEVQLAVPRSVRAATAALGLGRQRLALVVGIGSNGSRTVLDNAPRDAQAVAAALRSSGFVVMLREDLGALDLRANLKEFRERLQPGGIGFIYIAALGAQVDGHNLLLPRDLLLDAAAEPAAVVAHLRSGAVPVAELVDALIGPADSPRLLVVDAAWQHPGLNKLPLLGLTEQRLPPGTMALFGHGLGGVKDVPAVAPLPTPAPTDPAEVAATAFASMLVKALTTPRISGPDALRATRRALVESSQGQANPWLGGDTDAQEEIAEATLLDGLVPRSPEEIGREGARQVVKLGTRSGGRGEQTVAQVLEQTSGGPASSSLAGEDGLRPGETARRTVPEKPLPGSGNLIGTAAATVGAVGAVAGIAAAAATTAAAVQVAKASAVAEAATTAVGTAGALAARVIELATPAAAAPVAAVAAAPAPLAAPVAVAPAAADTRNAQRLAQAAASALTEALPEQERAAPARKAPPADDMRTLRNPQGGERPAYVPRGNSFGYAEGDTFTYRVTDTWKGEVTREYTTAIEEVRGNGELLANGQQLQLDPQGRVMRNAAADGSFSQFEPFQDLWWSNPQRGQYRAVKFVERFGHGNQVRGQTEWSGSTSVGRARKLATPAGEFEVLPIESSGWWTSSLANGGARESGQWSRTVWYSPKLGHPVAIDIEDADHLGKLLKRERIELLHAQTAKP